MSRRFSHVVTYDCGIIHSFTTEHLYELRLAERFITNDKVFSPISSTRNVGTLGPSPPLYLQFRSVFLPLRQDR